MNVKKVAPLAIALVLGLMAFWMALRVISKQQQTKTLTVTETHPQVVIAKTNIDAGSALTDDNTTTGEVNTDNLPDNVFKTTGEVLGRVATVPIIQGQAITQTLLAAKGVGAGLQAVVPVGMRAVTVDINEITGVAGNITPGCRVDILQSFTDPKSGDSIARTIAQNIKVTAIGMHRNPQDGQASGGNSATLLVTPQQAELIELSSVNGRARLSLRNANDLEVASTPGITLADLRSRENHKGSGDDSDVMAMPMLNGGAMDATGGSSSTRPASLASLSSTRPSAAIAEPQQWTMHIIRGTVSTQIRFQVKKAATPNPDIDSSGQEP